MQFWNARLDYFKKKPVSWTESEEFYGKISWYHTQKRLDLLEEYFPRKFKPVETKVKWEEVDDCKYA